MCEFCDPTRKDAAKSGTLHRVQQLTEFSYRLERFARGGIKPHTDEAAKLAQDAKRIIKFLAEDWL